MQVVEGNIRATGKKFAIVVSRFNSFVVESLLEGALDTLDVSFTQSPKEYVEFVKEYVDADRFFRDE